MNICHFALSPDFTCMTNKISTKNIRHSLVFEYVSDKFWISYHGKTAKVTRNMSYRDRAGYLRDAEISGSHSSSPRQYDVERNAGGSERFHVSTPTRIESQFSFNSTQQLFPPQNHGHPNESHTPMDYQSYQNSGPIRHRPDTSVLLSDEVISGSLTNGNRMS